MTATHVPAFATILSDSIKLLTLGQALSPARPGSLSQRHEEGFLLGEIRIGAAEPFVATADSEGRIGNDYPEGLSPDAAPLHAAALRVRAGAGGVALVRAPRLAAWGLSRRALPVRYFQMFGYTRAKEIPVSAADPRAVTEALADNPDTPALLLEDGRVLIWAPQPARAVRLVLSLEEAAHVTALADQLGGARDYPADAREKIYGSLQAQARR